MGMADRIALLESSFDKSGYAEEEDGDYSRKLVLSMTRFSPDLDCGCDNIIFPYRQAMGLKWGIPGDWSDATAFPGQQGRECSIAELRDLSAVSSHIFVKGKVAVVAVPAYLGGKTEFHGYGAPAVFMAHLLELMGANGGYDTIVCLDESGWDENKRDMCRKEGLPILYDSTGISDNNIVCPPGWENVVLEERRGYIKAIFPEKWSSPLLECYIRMAGLDGARHEMEDAIDDVFGLRIYQYVNDVDWLVSGLSYGALDVEDLEYELLSDIRGQSAIRRLTAASQMTDLLEDVRPAKCAYTEFADSLGLWRELCCGSAFGKPKTAEIEQKIGRAKEFSSAFDSHGFDREKRQAALDKLLEEGRQLGLDAAYAAIAHGVPAADASA